MLFAAEEGEEGVGGEFGEESGGGGRDDLVGEETFMTEEVVDAFLEGAFADEVVGDDGADLADAVGAVGGLVLDGGVPPAVVVDDVRGLGEGEAEGAGAEGENEESGAVITGEGLDLGSALRGGESAVKEGNGATEAFGEGGLKGCTDAGVLGEEEGGFAAGEDVVEEGKEGEEFAGGCVVESVSGAVADEFEARKKGEDGAMAIVGGAGVLGQSEVVGGGLGIGEGGVVLLGDAGRQVGENGGIGLETTEEEVRDGAAEAVGVGIALGEVATGAEEVGVEEVEDGPEVVEAVLDGGAGEGEAVRGGERAGGLGLAGGGVLDELGFIENEGLPLDAAEAGIVAPEVAIGGEDDVDLTGTAKEGIAQGTVRANVTMDTEAGGPVGKLAFPHGQDGKRGHDEGGGRAREEKGDGLQGLAEAHVVGEADTEAMCGGLHEPADTLGLVGAEHLAEGKVAGGGRGHLAQEVLHGLGAGCDAKGTGKEERQGAAFGQEGRAESFKGAAEGIEVNVTPFTLDKGEWHTGIQDGTRLSLGNLDTAKDESVLDADLFADHLDGGLVEFWDGGLEGGRKVNNKGSGAKSRNAFAEEAREGGGVPRLREGQQGRDGDGLAKQTERGDRRLRGIAAAPGLQVGKVQMPSVLGLNGAKDKHGTATLEERGGPDAQGIGQSGVGERKGGVRGAKGGEPGIVSGEKARLGGLGTGESGAGAGAHPKVGQGVNEPGVAAFGQKGGLPTGLAVVINGCDAASGNETHDAPPDGDGLLNLGGKDNEGRLQPGVEALQHLQDAASPEDRFAPTAKEKAEVRGESVVGERPPLGLAPEGKGVALAAESENHE